jgi:hypothetical protein
VMKKRFVIFLIIYTGDIVALSLRLAGAELHLACSSTSTQIMNTLETRCKVTSRIFLVFSEGP